MERVPFTTRLPRDLVKRVRAYSAKSDRTQSALVESALMAQMGETPLTDLAVVAKTLMRLEQKLENLEFSQRVIMQTQADFITECAKELNFGRAVLSERRAIVREKRASTWLKKFWRRVVRRVEEGREELAPNTILHSD